MAAEREHSARDITLDHRPEQLLVLLDSTQGTPVDAVDDIEGITGPKDLHEMHRLRHGRDAIEAFVEAVIRPPCLAAVGLLDGLREIIRKPADLPQVLRG